MGAGSRQLEFQEKGSVGCDDTNSYLVITMVAAAGVLFLYTGIAPVAKVTVTTTITATTPTITATTATTSADTSQIASLMRYLNLSNKTTLLNNNATVSIQGQQ